MIWNGVKGRGNSVSWLAGTSLISGALAFWYATSFTQSVFSTKGTIASGKTAHSLYQIVADNAFLLSLSALFLVLMLVAAVVVYCRAQKGEVGAFLSSRVGTSVVLVAALICQLPIYFSRGVIDTGDALCHINALNEAASNYAQGEWPFFTFHFLNGMTVGLQYPMGRTFWGGLLLCLFPGDSDLYFRVLSASAHILTVLGFYRFLRAFRFSRIACAIPALVLGGCHQMLVNFLSAAWPTQMASALACWVFYAVLVWIQRLEFRKSVLLGFLMGLTFLAHPVTALFTCYFLLPIAIYAFWKYNHAQRWLYVRQGLLSVLCFIPIALPYLSSIVVMNRYNTFKPTTVSAFQDVVQPVASNFQWLLKYTKFAISHSKTGEYISVLLALVAVAGIVMIFRARKTTLREKSFQYLNIYLLSLLVFGAILFYGRDLSVVGFVPGVALLKVYNRSFIFFALGMSLPAAWALHHLIRQGYGKWVLLLGVLFFFEQAPFWVRPTFFSLSESLRFQLSDFAQADKKTSSVFVVISVDGGGCANREDVFFHRNGFSGMSAIESEEQSVIGPMSQQFHVEMSQLKSAEELRPYLERLKWHRVTDVIWRRDALPSYSLDGLGKTSQITNGLRLQLDAPRMERSLRTARLSIAPADQQSDGTVTLPIGYNPFLQARIGDRNLDLTNRNGYLSIREALPVGTIVDLRAVTPAWLSLVAWISLFSTVCLGGYLVLERSRR